MNNEEGKQAHERARRFCFENGFRISGAAYFNWELANRGALLWLEKTKWKNQQTIYRRDLARLERVELLRGIAAGSVTDFYTRGHCQPRFKNQHGRASLALKIVGFSLAALETPRVVSDFVREM
jgi:hypothetical protein